MNEDRRNTFGILMCRKICDGTGAELSDGAPSTCSSLTCLTRLYSQVSSREVKM